MASPLSTSPTSPTAAPLVDGDTTQDAWLLCESIPKNCLAPFRDLLYELKTSEGVPPVSCVVSDDVMSFTLEAAEELPKCFVLDNQHLWVFGLCLLLPTGGKGVRAPQSFAHPFHVYVLFTWAPSACPPTAGFSSAPTSNSSEYPSTILSTLSSS
ncbi:hypothetical protein RJ639_024630 [Escallonia herrerae]|uniref:Uncharacterized protein n=1 Tax=Escallonia herrerae TaxID=1293975 RepID=A0AA89ACW4_9ASTE|nr:hypothetical protein RJ639_024630 [Escallonia herrerae]